MKKIRTHYDTLKVARDAPASVIRAAYRTLSQEFHPDRSGNPDADRIMKEINVSYGVLSDATQRRIHDDWIAKQEAFAAAFSGHESGPGSRPKPEPKPDPQPSPPRPNASPHPQQTAAPDVSRQDRPWGIRAVPARLWILAAIVLSYSMWLMWNRIVVVNMQTPQTTSLASDAPDKRTAAAPASADPVATSRESMAAHSKSETDPSRKASPLEHERPRQDTSRAPRNQRDAAATTMGSESTAAGLPEKEPGTAADPDDRVDQPGERGNNDSPAEPMAAANARAQEASGVLDRQTSQSSQRFVLQVAALGSAEKAAELQASLRGAGISSHTIKRGELIIVRVGPLPRNEADKVRGKLARIGLSGFMTPL
jgi:cell division septation protein DedD